MLTIKYQTAFKKDYKRVKKRGYDMKLLEEAISILAVGSSASESCGTASGN